MIRKAKQNKEEHPTEINVENRMKFLSIESLFLHFVFETVHL